MPAVVFGAGRVAILPIRADSSLERNVMTSKSSMSQGQIRDFLHPGSYWLQRAEHSDLQGNLLRAAVLMRHGIGQEECGPAAELQYAWLLRRLGCIDASLRECRHVLSTHPSRFTAFGLMALNYTDTGRQKAAMDAHMIYSQFVEMFPFAVAPWDAEVGEMEEWIFSFPGEEMPHARAARKMKKAWDYLEEDDLPAAEALLRSLPRSRRQTAEGRLLEACLAPDGETCRRLLHSLQGSSLMKDPDALLRCAAAAGRFSRRRGARLLIRAACLAKTPAQLGRLSHLCFDMGVSHIAKSALKAALADCPTRPDALFNLCVFALKEGDYAAGRKLAYRLYLLDPEDPSVEKLWELSLRIGDLVPPDGELLEAIRRQPFYAMRDSVLENTCREWLRAVEENPDSNPLSPRKTRIRMQYLFERVLTPPETLNVIGRMMQRGKHQSAQSMLRGYMLSGPGSWGLRRASRLLLLMDKPPYMAMERDKLRLYHPHPMNTRSDAFLQRRIFGTLRILRKKLGKECLPYALETLNRLPRRYRSAFLGQERFVWVSAFSAQYALYRGHLMRPADSIMLWPSRRKLWLKACRIIRKTLKGLKTEPASARGKEPSYDETH